MATTFHALKNNVSTVAAADRPVGGTTLAVRPGDGAKFGDEFPTTASIYRNNAPITILEVTGRSGDTLQIAGGSYETADAAVLAGDVVANATCSMYIEELQEAIHGAEGDIVDINAILPQKAPLAHQHAAGDIVSGTIAPARLGSGIPDGTTFLRGDQAWATPPGGAGSTPGGSTGQLQYNNAGAFGGTAQVAYSNASPNLIVTAANPAYLPLAVRQAGSGQTANLQEWQTNAGTTISSVSSAGIFTGNGSGLTNLTAAGSTGQLQYNNAGAFGGTARVTYATSGTILTATAGAASDKILTLQGAASQSGNFVEVRDQAGNLLTAIGPAGAVNSYQGGSLAGQFTTYATNDTSNSLVTGLNLRPGAGLDVGIAAGNNVSGLGTNGPTIFVAETGAVGVGMTSQMGAGGYSPFGTLNVMCHTHYANGVVIQLPPPADRAVATISCTGNVATITLTTNHTLYPGGSVTISGVATNTWLNGAWTVSATPSANSFQVAVTHSNVTSMSDSGNVNVVATNNPLAWSGPSGETMGYITAYGHFVTYGGNVMMYPVARPTTPLVSPIGTGGGTTYSYRITAFNLSGETLPSTAGITSAGNATLSASNYNQVTWNHVPGAAYYKVYGRTSGSEQLMATVYGTANTVPTYLDKGAAVPSGALPGSVAGVTFTMKAFEGQTYGLMSWQDSGGTARSYVDCNGYHVLIPQAGAPASAPADGCLYVDSTNNRLWVRVNGVWKYAQLN